ncbi:MAG: MmgE/PrpD family protein [Chloroflexi bacterium]|nr:MmgE/PrpD family protein [Chloroflexota bacterium]MDA1228434.1 MmgE/PrpD family protein [Chloroflexota bacterium]
MTQHTRDSNDSQEITKKLAKFSADLTYEDLSPEVVDWAKYLCLDFAGVALNGSTTDSAKAVVKAIEGLNRPGPSTIIGTPKRTLPEYAAMANGTAFHSIELDDVNNEASLHPGVVAYPTAMAMADVVPVNGKSFITSVVAGYDVMVRLGRALKPAEHYGRGFHPTGTCGAFGAAAVAGRLLGLQGDSFAHALGIAGSQTAGSMEYLAQGAWTKRLHPGWASHSGIWAALLAQSGFLGPTTILEGDNGFLQGYSGHPDPGEVLRGLGDGFLITQTSIKPHSCCRYNQGPIDCVLDLRQTHNLRPEEIKNIRVGMLNAGFGLVAFPEEQKRNPSSVVDMQFSMPFSAAVALAYGRASLSEYAPGVPERPAIRELMAKVKCVKDPELDSTFPSQWRAWVEVDTNDGRKLRSEITHPKGDVENGLTWDEMKQKFHDLSAPVVSKQRQSEIIDSIESLETMDDVHELASLLAT